MSGSLAEYLEAERHRMFVGREAEQAVFQSWLAAGAAPFHVLYVHGPGGVGKTALLQEFQRLCRAAEMPVSYVDARDVEPSTPALVGALYRALGPGTPPPASLDDVLVALEGLGRAVLMVDTYEALAPLDRWMRERFVMRLPSAVLLVLSGRRAPSPGWRADPGLQAVTRVLPLRNFSPQEGRRYLARRQVPEARRASALAITHGHPLALSLVADALEQHPGSAFDLAQTPDIVAALLQRFLQETPTPGHRLAASACALVRHTTEPLLAELLQHEDAHALFEWLRKCSFVEGAPGGLFPHDLARDVLVADLRWRAPETFEALHRRARLYYTRLLQARPQRPASVLTSYLFLYRQHPVIQPFFTQLRSKWREGPAWILDAMEEADQPALSRMVARHEGAVSETLFRYWAERQPESVHVFRGAGGAPAGFALLLALDDATPADRARDPAVAAAWAYLADHAPLRAGERATLIRFWMDRDAYQDISPVQSLIFVLTVRHYLTTPRLAFSFLPCGDPGFWQLPLAYANLARLSSADFDVGSRSYGMFGHDWRVRPPASWLQQIAERGVPLAAPHAEAAAAAPDVLVLSRPDFGEAVKEALKAYTRADALHANPLLRSRLVLARAGREADPLARAQALRTLVREVADALEAAPREARGYRALHATYFEPARTQEQAAERLGLPFSTFRRHLSQGIDLVTEALWQRELGA